MMLLYTQNPAPLRASAFEPKPEKSVGEAVSVFLPPDPSLEIMSTERSVSLVGAGLGERRRKAEHAEKEQHGCPPSLRDVVRRWTQSLCDKTSQ